MFAFTVYTMGIIPIYNLSTYAEDLRTEKKTNTIPHCKVTNVVSLLRSTIPEDSFTRHNVVKLESRRSYPVGKSF